MDAATKQTAIKIAKLEFTLSDFCLLPPLDGLVAPAGPLAIVAFVGHERPLPAGGCLCGARLARLGSLLVLFSLTRGYDKGSRPRVESVSVRV